MNLFVVESPTQTLNAIEAKHRFELEDCCLVILLTGLFNRGMYERVVSHFYWNKVVYVEFYFVGRDFDFGRNRPEKISEKLVEIGGVLDLFRKRFQIDRIARRAGPVEKLFLGQYRLDTHLYFRHFANVCQHKELFLLDDGTDTLLINNQRQIEASGVTEDVQGNPKNQFKRIIKNRFGKWNFNGVNSLTFFTNLKIEESKRDFVIFNDYRWLKDSMVKGEVVRGRVFFLGQTLIDDGYLTVSDYLNILQQIKECFPDREFQYIAHPRESLRYQDLLTRNLNIPVLRFDVPVELEMAVSCNRPEILAGFFCSALENCAKIFGEDVRVQAYRLDSKILLKDHAIIANIYSHLDSVELIELIEVAAAAPQEKSTG